MALKEGASLTNRLGKRIVQLRKSKGITQRDLAYDADLDISTLSRLERGLLNPRLSTLEAISSVLNVPIKDLFSFEDN